MTEQNLTVWLPMHFLNSEFYLRFKCARQRPVKWQACNVCWLCFTRIY